MGINSSMYTGLTGLNSFSTALSIVSDNVANANTTGYKTNSARFGDLVSGYYDMLTNDLDRLGAGSTVMQIDTDYGGGSMASTNNWSDMAVSGEGFFMVKDATSGNTYYTRDGGFRLDSTGNLVDQMGYNVQGDVGGALANITIANPTNYTNFRVGSDGQLYAVDHSLATPTEVAIPNAKIALANFTNKNGLIRQGLNLYSAGGQVGTTYYSNGTTVPPGMFGSVLGYNLEGSNVDIAKQMVDMIVYQSDYNANSKTITTGSNLLETSINMVR